MIGTNNADGTPNFCIITWLGFSADSVPCLMMTIGGSKLTKTNIPFNIFPLSTHLHLHLNLSKMKTDVSLLNLLSK